MTEPPHVLFPAWTTGPHYESQKREAMIGCNVLNRMAKLGQA